MLRPDFVPDGGQPDPQSNNFFAPGQPGGQAIQQQQQFSMMPVNSGIPPSHPGANGQRYYTIQRVNGNGGNGKGDGVAGPHKHPLSESDRVKKNSVQRYLMKKDKDEKKTQVSTIFFYFWPDPRGVAMSLVKNKAASVDWPFSQLRRSAPKSLWILQITTSWHFSIVR
jgi:hypothetical protein